MLLAVTDPIQEEGDTTTQRTTDGHQTLIDANAAASAADSASES